MGGEPKKDGDSKRVNPELVGPAKAVIAAAMARCEGVDLEPPDFPNAPQRRIVYVQGGSAHNVYEITDSPELRYFAVYYFLLNKDGEPDHIRQLSLPREEDGRIPFHLVSSQDISVKRLGEMVHDLETGTAVDGDQFKAVKQLWESRYAAAGRRPMDRRTFNRY